MSETDYLGLFNSLPEPVRLKLQIKLRDTFLEVLGLKSEFKMWLEQNFDDIIEKIINKLKNLPKDMKIKKEDEESTKYIELLAELFGDD